MKNTLEDKELSNEEKLRLIREAYERSLQQPNNQLNQEAGDARNLSFLLNNLNKAAALAGGYKPTADFSQYGEMAADRAKQAELARQQSNQQALQKMQLDTDMLKMGEQFKDTALNRKAKEQSIAAGAFDLASKKEDRVKRLVSEEQAKQYNPQMALIFKTQLNRNKKEAERVGDTDTINMINEQLNNINQYEKINNAIKSYEGKDTTNPEIKRNLEALKLQLNKLQTPSSANLSQLSQASKNLPSYSRPELDTQLKEADLLKKKQEVLLAGKKTKEGTPLKPHDITNLAEGNVIPNMLDNLENTIEKNPESFGPIVGRTLGQIPYNTTSKTIESEVRTAAQIVGKYMEGGVLRKEDEEKYRRMLPNLTDTPDIAKAKLGNVRRMLREKQAEYLRAFKASGYDTSAFDKGQQSKSSSSQTTNQQVRKIGNRTFIKTPQGWLEQ